MESIKMVKKLLIFLAIFSGLIQAGQEKTYKVKASDSKVLELSKSKIMQFNTFSSMLEDLDPEESDIVIPLPEKFTYQAFEDLLALTELGTEQEIKEQLAQLELSKILDIIKAGNFLGP